VTVLREFLRRRNADRRTGTARSGYEDARTLLATEKYTGEVRVIWAQGVEKEFRIQNDVVIELTR